MRRLTGRPAAVGIAAGRAVVAVREAQEVRYRLAASGVERERQRLRAARERTRAELEEISARVSATAGPTQAAIFAAQLLMLDDPMLTRRADDLIRTERLNAGWALERAVTELREVFAREGDAWLRDRTGDIADVGGRLQRNLRPTRHPLVDLVQELEPPLIVVADELPPSLAAQLDWSRVRGLVSELGSPTHHTVILLRSLDVPAVVGLAGVAQMIAPGDTLALDGATGEVLVSPSPEVMETWRQRAERAALGTRALATFRQQPGRTADGVRIRLEANLEIADDVARVREAGAEGIGLFRSEFLLDAAEGADLSEDLQEETYRRLLEAMRPLPVTVRTFDAGGDHWVPGPRPGAHRGRFGFRSARAAHLQDDRFRTQIRALLRASEAGLLRILLPFVTTAEEVRQARELITELGRTLGVARPVPVGAMIEVPAAALTVDRIAASADFLSVGTNDLIQYTLAVDRADDWRGGQDESAEPAVLRLLRLISRSGRRAGVELSVCGEMAADLGGVAVLVGLGFRAFSMSAAAIPVVKHGLGGLDSCEAAAVARRALGAATAEDVRVLLGPVVARMLGAPTDAGTESHHTDGQGETR